MNAPIDKTTYTVHEAKTNLSRLIRDALAGQEIIIARGDKPVVKLVALEAEQPKRVPGTWKGRIKTTDQTFAPWTKEELGHWEDKSLFPE